MTSLRGSENIANAGNGPAFDVKFKIELIVPDIETVKHMEGTSVEGWLMIEISRCCHCKRGGKG
jgi:hypothetical protein